MMRSRPEILVAEDERLVAFNLATLLERMGYAVPVTVASGEEAVAAARDRRPDLVLMDIRLKGAMDGIEAAEAIVAEQGIPVVYLTSYTDDETLKRAVRTRSYGYLLKPFQEKLLHVTIDMALSKHRVERQLQERTRWLDTTLGSIGDGVLATDGEGTALFLNHVAERMIGRSRAEALGRPLEAVFHLEDGEGNTVTAETLSRVLQEGSVVTTDDPLTLLAEDGHAAPVSLNAAPILDAEGAVAGAVIVVRDISRVLELEKQLRHSQKMEAVSTLAAGIAHDFNNILCSIIGYTELSLNAVTEGSQVHDNMHQVIRAASRAADLVRHILTFSRQQERERRPIPLHPVLREAVKLLRATLPATIDIQVEMDETCGTVLADSTQIHQVVMNLCTNAFHAMRETGGALEVRLNRVDAVEGGPMESTDARHVAYVRLTVRDTGVGMDRATLARIFEPYFTTKPMGEGSGLGLAVVHGIVNSHGGIIDVSSEPRKGTEFNVYFPVHGDEAAVDRQAERVLSDGGEHILFVDDEPRITRFVQQMLENFGYRVTSHTNSVAARDDFLRDPASFDMVITDQTMPQLTGSELAAEVLRARPDIPIFLITGNIEARIPADAREKGIREIIQKPFTAEHLAGRIRKALDHRPPAVAGDKERRVAAIALTKNGSPRWEADSRQRSGKQRYKNNLLCFPDRS